MPCLSTASFASGAIEDLHDFFGQPRDDILRCLRDKEGVDTEIADRAQHQGVL